MSVAKSPGATQTASILKFFTSIRIDSVINSKAPLLAEYAPLNGSPIYPAMDVILIINPLR